MQARGVEQLHASRRGLLGIEERREIGEARIGTAGLPTWPCWEREGSGASPVSQWKTVVFPEPEKPAMPIFMEGPNEVLEEQ